MATTIDTIAKGAEEQAESTIEASNGLDLFGEYIEENDKNIGVLRDVAEDVQRVVSEGLERVSQLSIKGKETEAAIEEQTASYENISAVSVELANSFKKLEPLLKKFTL